MAMELKAMLALPPIGTPSSVKNGLGKKKLGGGIDATVNEIVPLADAVPMLPLNGIDRLPVVKVLAAVNSTRVPPWATLNGIGVMVETPLGVAILATDALPLVFT